MTEQIKWMQTSRDCWVGLVGGSPRFEVDVYPSGGWRRAALYCPPGRLVKAYGNVSKAKEAARALLSDVTDKGGRG